MCVQHHIPFHHPFHADHHPTQSPNQFHDSKNLQYSCLRNLRFIKRLLRKICHIIFSASVAFVRMVLANSSNCGSIFIFSPIFNFPHPSPLPKGEGEKRKLKSLMFQQHLQPFHLPHIHQTFFFPLELLFQC